MPGDRFYFGSDGSFRGFSSDKDPFSGLFKLIGIIILLFILRGCD